MISEKYFFASASKTAVFNTTLRWVKGFFLLLGLPAEDLDQKNNFDDVFRPRANNFVKMTFRSRSSIKYDLYGIFNF